MNKVSDTAGNETNINFELCFYILAMHSQKMKLENNSTYNTTKKNKTLRNKFNRIQNLHSENYKT